jgi:hypothetical protein
MQELYTLTDPVKGFEDLYSVNDWKAVGKLQKIIKTAKSRPFKKEYKESGTVTVQLIST